MNTYQIAIAFVLSASTVALAGPGSSSSYYVNFSQYEFNTITERIGNTQNPWSVHLREGAAILGDGSTGAGPLDSEVQFGRLVSLPFIIAIPSDSEGVVRKSFFGKRVMRVGGKEFVDKGFGWKQTYGPFSGPGLLEGGNPLGLPGADEDQLIENIWNGKQGAIDDFNGPQIGVPDLGSNTDGGYPGRAVVGDTQTKPEMLGEDLRRILESYGQNGQDNGESNGADDKTGLGGVLDEKASSDATPTFRLGGELRDSVQESDAARSRFVVSLKYTF